MSLNLKHTRATLNKHSQYLVRSLSKPKSILEEFITRSVPTNKFYYIRKRLINRVINKQFKNNDEGQKSNQVISGMFRGSNYRHRRVVKLILRMFSLLKILGWRRLVFRPIHRGSVPADTQPTNFGLSRHLTISCLPIGWLQRWHERDRRKGHNTKNEVLTKLPFCWEGGRRRSQKRESRKRRISDTRKF